MLDARPTANWEKIFIGANTYIQFAMKLNDPKDVPNVIKKLDKTVAGLHHASDGKTLFRTTEKVPIANLPDDVSDLEKLTTIMSERYTRPASQALASLGANKDTVVLNINHLAGDGMYLQNMFTQLKSCLLYTSPSPRD